MPSPIGCQTSREVLPVACQRDGTTGLPQATQSSGGAVPVHPYPALIEQDRPVDTVRGGRTSARLTAGGRGTSTIFEPLLHTHMTRCCVPRSRSVQDVESSPNCWARRSEWPDALTGGLGAWGPRRHQPTPGARPNRRTPGAGAVRLGLCGRAACLLNYRVDRFGGCERLLSAVVAGLLEVLTGQMFTTNSPWGRPSHYRK